MARGKSRSRSEGASSANGEEVVKIDLVRKALKVLGKDAKPLALQAYLRENDNHDMATNMISSYKSMLTKRKKKKKAAAQRSEPSAPKAAAAKASPAHISLKDIRAVKGLTSRLGAARVRELAEVLSK